MTEKPIVNPSARQAGDTLGLGVFLGYWSVFDLAVEILIMRQLRLSEKEASIVCGGLMFSAKISILYSLLNRDEKNKRGVELLKNIVSLAERNDLIHGFLIPDRSDPTKFTLVRRTVREKYNVRAEELNMMPHVRKFMGAVDNVMEHFSLTEIEIHKYARLIEADA